MAHRDWNASYASGELPWDTGEPEPLLVEFVSTAHIQPTRALEIGAGTGTNSIWLGERGRFAAQVAAALASGGLWLSLIGSTEGEPREVGPPRRSGRDVTLAIEPALEILELRADEFRGHGAPAWFCLSRKRAIPAQPSTRHD
jgi:Thiopurine S-methyltransferase (TPMT)